MVKFGTNFGRMTFGQMYPHPTDAPPGPNPTAPLMPQTLPTPTPV